MDRMRMVVEHLWWGPRRKGMTGGRRILPEG